MPSPGAAPGRCLEQWTISGEVTLIGEPGAPVKLAGFYTAGDDFFYAAQAAPDRHKARLVSNVAGFPPTGGAFTLSFDVSGLPAGKGHYIYLILWIDANGNGMYDPGEEWRYVIPLFDDPIFQAATDCVYYYDDRENERTGCGRGWNQSVGMDRYVPVTGAVREGARLANEAAWSPFLRQEPERAPAVKGLDHGFRSGIDSLGLHASVSPGGLAQLVERQVRNL